MKGSPGLKIDQQGVAYRFSTPESRDRFQKDPTASAPQRGSYSVFGMARRKRYDFDPKPWDIIDCKFYLSRNKKPGTLSEGNPAGHLNSTNQTGEKPAKNSRSEETIAFIWCKACDQRINPGAVGQPKRYSTVAR